MTITAWVYFWALYFVLLIYVSLYQFHDVLIAVALQYSLKSGSVIPPTLFFFLKISLAIQGLLWFYINVRVISSSAVKNVMGILIGIALNL